MHLAIVVAALSAASLPVSPPASCAAVSCLFGWTCHVTDEGAMCLKNCETTCGTVVSHGWSGYDDGSNACNTCTCTNGAMTCTEVACPDVSCPEDTARHAQQQTICCQAIPTCSENYSQVTSCTDDEFAEGVCVSVSLCCTTITCKANTA